MKQLTKWVKNIFYILFLLVFIFVGVSLFQSNEETNEANSIFGFSILNVLTGSMDPAIKPGDLAIVKNTEPKTIKEGDIITFQSSDQTLVTHRVISTKKEDGAIAFETKGDANNVKDEEVVTSEQLIGTYQFKIPKLGYLIDFIKTPLGIFMTVFIVLSILAIEPIKKYLRPNAQKASH